jgi:hypothetical protein
MLTRTPVPGIDFRLGQPVQIAMIRKAMNKKHQIPAPAHPHKRREALPWQQPKATEEDPEALRLVQAILNSPSYFPAQN